MRKILAIIINKLIRVIGNYFGRGSSFPGKIALKICPDILSRIRLPEYVIAVTGSNGKTSTAEMIAHILEKSGKSVAYNHEGSNQIEGVTTLILDNSTLFGRFKKDYLVIETDERYTKYIFRYFAPTHYVITNLYRDQMTRNGHPEFVLKDIEKSIRRESRLIVNADDPLVSSMAKRSGNIVTWFGIDDNAYVSEKCDSVYDDGYYCPICGNKMIYSYRQFAHVGNYHCTSCDFQRENPDYAITDINLEKGSIRINSQYQLDLAFSAIYNAYNVLAAFSVTSLLGINEEMIVQILNHYLITNGRFRRFVLGSKQGTLLISKHENSISYNRNLKYIADSGKDISLLIIIDDISRKYFTSDTSWIWDIDFEILKKKNIKDVIIAGKYIYDVASRLRYSGIDMNKVVLRRNVDTAVAYMRYKTTGELYVLTCFSDVAKFLKEVSVE